MLDNVWIGIILFTATSFIVGLSGAMVPGPMLTVTISDSLKKGATAGPKIVFGHIITEFILILLIFAGLGWLIGSETAIFVIGAIGGLIMVLMGFQMARSSNSLQDLQKSSETSKGYGPIINGILTSVSNPYFFIWWATVGWAFMLKGIELAGILGVTGFLVGHWCSDLGWFGTVSIFTTKGSNIMKDNHYKIIMSVSGIFLMILGVYFVISSCVV
ncbi:Lysine exporter protein (LYSE/YGGA) [Methanobacterium lacus]|uniref:Lysine exporter protein (LYSE/YGGA) n=1 Tax=Methanobacterium lacus (strain AL-21) TaxID=877455 RepID=F0T6S3_METLA|nr:LysE family transporter [Methanobacterium lacus]ADZ08306.1 Lysine exporter protein (LYSE/YGGA) [Methanobacterium lacus]